ncbi:MAG: T9SS type A sorting domain-containing protein [Bacteroidetes bacterium]|nr:T9SS type A sorting domain-containing protein [Bacteroidota bacterium]
MKKILLLISACFALSSQAQTYQVGHCSINFKDASRTGGYAITGSSVVTVGGTTGRDIGTEIYYPAATAGNNVAVATGTFPVVVFGHGFVMTWDAYTDLWTNLVSNGYIVCLARTEGGFSPVHLDFGKDLAKIADYMSTTMTTTVPASPVPSFVGKINPRVALSGHSMGGGSSFLGAQNNTSIKTMLNFAAANTNPSSQHAAKFITVPSLVLSGENDCVAPPAQHQKPEYDSLIITNTKAYMSVKGGDHCSFASRGNTNCMFGQGTCSPQPTISEAQQKSAAYMAAKLWLDYFLKEDCSAWPKFKDTLNTSVRFVNNTMISDIVDPAITAAGAVLTCTTPAASYQWYLNNNPIASATSNTYNATSNGNYYCEVKYVYTNCPYNSNIVNINTTGIQSFTTLKSFAVYPNPTQGKIYVSYTSESSTPLTFEVYDIAGRVVLTSSEESLPGVKFNKELNIESLERGTYILYIHQKEFKGAYKIIKQ